MEGIFLTVLRLSIAATFLIAFVVIARLLLRRAPKWISCVLWAIVAVRLLCPFFISSPASLVPRVEPADIGIETVEAEVPQTPDAGDITVTPGTVTAEDDKGVSTVQVLSVVWIVGVAAMLAYSGISYLNLHRRTRENIPAGDGTYVCDKIGTPFILGIFRPRIFIPASVESGNVPFITAHEKAHIKRGDHFIKPLGFLILSVYWFNPAVWAAYVLLCRDIELACDEKVIKAMGEESKKGYSMALINCSSPMRIVSACPLAFGGTKVKGRIRHVLNYKKPAFWIVAAGLAACIVATVCFMTVRPGKDPEKDTPLIKCKHVYDETVTVKADCEKDGKAVLTCKKCGNSYEKKIKATGHDFLSEEKEKATCIKGAVTLMTCKVCGKTEEKVGEPDPAAHALTETVVDATCISEGSKTVSCSLCGYSETETYPMTDHDFFLYYGDYTCTEAGYEYYKCYVCETEKKVPKEAPGHVWIEASCNHPKHCDNCGATEGEKLYHTVYGGTCTRCGKEIEDTVISGYSGIGEQIPTVTGGYVVISDPQVTYEELFQRGPHGAPNLWATYDASHSNMTAENNAAMFEVYMVNDQTGESQFIDCFTVAGYDPDTHEESYQLTSRLFIYVGVDGRDLPPGSYTVVFKPFTGYN